MTCLQVVQLVNHLAHSYTSSQTPEGDGCRVIYFLTGEETEAGLGLLLTQGINDVTELGPDSMRWIPNAVTFNVILCQPQRCLVSGPKGAPAHSVAAAESSDMTRTLHPCPPRTSRCRKQKTVVQARTRENATLARLGLWPVVFLRRATLLYPLWACCYEASAESPRGTQRPCT